MHNAWQNFFNRLAPFSFLFKAKVIADFLTYCFGAILVRGASFFILPLVMHKLPPAHYGIVSLATAFIAITTAIIGLGLRQLLSIEFFHAQKSARPALLYDIITLYTLIALPTTIGIWYLRAYVVRFIFFNTLNTWQFVAILISIYLFFYVELLYQLLQYTRRAKQLTLIQCTVACLTASSSLFFVFYCNIGITGMLWAQTVGTIAATLLAIGYAVAYLPTHRFHFTMKNTRYYLLYGLPFIPGIIASWVLSSLDRWILGYFSTMYEVGIYAVADLASQLFYSIILQSWASSYLPYIMQQYHSNSHNIVHIERENRRIMTICLLGCALTLIFSYPIIRIIVMRIVPSCYHASLPYAFILLLGQVFLLGSYFSSTLLQYKKCTYFLAAALVIPALLNGILNFIFTPLWGIMGCSSATLISYFIYFMITFLYSKKMIH